ncbi:MAG: hypothetical protein JWO67_6556 [Streptosporangiaceae bacterium]|nr:hypothetical protein [Streptosporangiaceae bacterium]
MRHFDHIPRRQRDRLFHRSPQSFSRASDAETLAVALGATLYSPATRPDLGAVLRKSGARGITSMVMCLEDAVPDEDLVGAEHNLVEQLRGAYLDGAAGPLLFIRVRAPEQIPDLTRRLGAAAELVSGFVLPKFASPCSGAFLDAVEDTAMATGLRLFAMPVIESRQAAYRETRADTLDEVAALLAKHRERVLAVRLGGTDLCAAYGLRRPRDLTIYDVHPVAGVIADVVNVLGRADGTGFVVTGPVWEYFSAGGRGAGSRPRPTSFDGRSATLLRERPVTADLDGLIREVHLDKANGLTGKTVIHPSHVAAVHAMSVVTHEEFCDATDIAGEDGGGAMASSYANKMNEAKPHRAWAERLLLRARVFGVAAEGVTFQELLDAAVAE